MARGTDGVLAGSASAARRVTTAAEAEQVAKEARQRLIRPSDLEDDRPPIRLYYIEDEGTVIAWVRSILVYPETAYVASVFTTPSHRRRGLATQLLYRMLADDAVLGAAQSVLLASGAGDKLYRSVGYTRIGSLLVFSPLRSNPAE